MACYSCEICKAIDAIKVRDVTWCPDCGQREVGESLTRCVMCEAERWQRPSSSRTSPLSDPTCTCPDCEAPNHCLVCHVHHPVDSMVLWCIESKG